MGIFPHELPVVLPVVLCAICAKPLSFAEQAVAVADKDGRRVHWDCWLKGNQLPQNPEANRDIT
jgi:hypothetical protein